MKLENQKSKDKTDCENFVRAKFFRRAFFFGKFNSVVAKALRPPLENTRRNNAMMDVLWLND